MLEKLVEVKTRVPRDAAKTLRKQARDSKVSLATRLRSIILTALLGAPPPQEPLYAFKFMIPADRPRPVPPEIEAEIVSRGGTPGEHTFSDCIAIAVAHNEDEARSILLETGRLTGTDMRWVLKGCCEKIVQLPIDRPCFIANSMH